MSYDSKTKLQTFASHLPTLYGRKNWQLLWQTYTLVRNWDKVAGTRIASHSEPAYVQKNTLWVFVHDSVWMQHMHSMKPQIIEQVHRFLPDLHITDIRWIMQSAESPREDRQVDEKSPPSADPFEKKAFEQLSAAVENEECRKALCRLWSVYQRNR